MNTATHIDFKVVSVSGWTLLIFFALVPSIFSQKSTGSQDLSIETKYDAATDQSTVRLPRFQVSGEKGNYYSLHSLVYFNYPGHIPRLPDSLTFELQTIVKARRLKIDLYVQLLVDDEKIFLSSNRWAEKKRIEGKHWIGEHIALRMPYEVFVKIAKARDFAIQLDDLRFSVPNEQLQKLRDFHAYIMSIRISDLKHIP